MAPKGRVLRLGARDRNPPLFRTHNLRRAQERGDRSKIYEVFYQDNGAVNQNFYKDRGNHIPAISRGVASVPSDALLTPVEPDCLPSAQLLIFRRIGGRFDREHSLQIPNINRPKSPLLDLRAALPGRSR